MGVVRGVDLPDDLIRLILVKLPVKSLLRLRLVSKTWHHLINSPTFIFHHHSAIMSQRKSGNSDLGYMLVRYPLRDGLGLFFSRIWVAAQGDPNVTTSKQVNENIHMPYVEAGEWEMTDMAIPIPGLYPAGFGLYCIFQFQTKRVALWNPSIRELKVLPSPPFSFSETGPLCGFGHVGYNKDAGGFFYVLGQLSVRYEPQDESHHYFSIELYSSATNSWKLLKDCHRVARSRRSATSRIWIAKGPYLDGKFHWLPFFSEDDPHIIWFDVNRERFGRVEVPPAAVNGIKGQYLLTKFEDEFLCLVLLWESRIWKKRYLDMWVMRQYGVAESWAKESTFGPLDDTMYYTQVMGIGRFCTNHVGGMFLQDMDELNKLYLCDPATSRVYNLGVGSDIEEWMKIVDYDESLVSMNGTSDGTLITKFGT